MATANFAGNGQQKIFEQLLCLEGLSDKLSGQLTFVLVLNAFLSVSAFVGNALILIALHKESSLHPPSKLLLRNLATNDLCFGLISEPLTVIYRMSKMNEHWNICRVVLLASMRTASILCSVSLLTLTAICVDRLLALLLRLQYRQVVTLKRTYVMVITIWIVSTVFTATGRQYCNITLWYWLIVTPLSLVTSIFSYAKIFFTLRHHQNQVQSHRQQQNQTNQLNIARYRRAVTSAIWLQLTLVASYLPYGVVLALWTNSGVSSSVYQAWIYSQALVYLNSSLNPILYCWKLEEVRQAVKNTIRAVLCYCFAT